jgi:PAS domain S-box-containing protein
MCLTVHSKAGNEQTEGFNLYTVSYRFCRRRFAPYMLRISGEGVVVNPAIPIAEDMRVRSLDDPALSDTDIKKEATRYALAIIAAIAALVLRKVLNPLLGSDNPYLTAWAAVVFSAWYCGIGASIVAVIITSVGIWYWLLPPYDSLAIQSHTHLFGLLGFLTFSAVIVLLGEHTRRVVFKRERAEAEQRAVHEQLENRVRQRTAALEERTAALQQKTAEVIEKATLLDLANDAIFVKSANGTISYWNQGATRLYGWSMTEALGHVPAELLHSEYPVPLSEIESRDEWEGEIRHTKKDGSRIIVVSRWAKIRDSNGNLSGWLEINTDITSRKSAEDAARALSGRILTLQDEERRRIAKGLHDSLGQYLAALKMNLDGFPSPTPPQAAIVSESAEIVDKCLTETRTISHLLHPPLLDESGFGSAARWYAEGFSRRSGIEVNLELPQELMRLHPDVEIALFRAVQECLTNIHKHANGSSVDIRMTQDAKRVRLEISDNGHGMTKERLHRLLQGTAEIGVGIAGMRERFRELGGSLEIRSNRKGTTVIVTAPVPQGTAIGSAEASESTRSVSAA